ncbi:type IV toxin-antitoxin system AbiEi family antitoxin [Microbispora bryophytorum]|uniref:type IV toxin-antitoxin system AbiEi family antitoxin n=1 Tax=Microbispora bryophytorum TaxID=1460882 RepID=UPI00340ACE64
MEEYLSSPLAPAYGLGRHDLSRLVASGRFWRPTRGGYYAGPDPRALAVRAHALGITSRDVVACRRTAAWLWGLDVLPPGKRQDEWPVEVVVPGGARTPPRRAHVIGRQSDRLPPGDVTSVGGVTVTTQERTALDCARWLPRLEAVAALDQFLARGVARERLRARAAELSGRRNARRLREAIALGDAGAQSPPESWVRVLVVDAGLPRPRPQVRVELPEKRVAYLDMGVERYRVGIEYDGHDHHSSVEDRAHDEWRRAQIRRLGWRLVIVRKNELFGSPATFLERVAERLWESGWRPTPGESLQLQRQLRLLGSPEARYRRYAA